VPLRRWRGLPAAGELDLLRAAALVVRVILVDPALRLALRTDTPSRQSAMHTDDRCHTRDGGATVRTCAAMNLE
jgi:hypothetical protein